MEQDKWNRVASNVIRHVMIDSDMTYKQLANDLAEIGLKYDDRVLANKIKRGTFSFAFFLQLARALELEEINFDGRILRIVDTGAAKTPDAK